LIAPPNVANDQRGATYVEFILAFVPVFVLFLAMVQMGLMYAANLVVTHSATTAARAAVVVLPDDPRHYEGEPVNQISLTDTSGRASGDSVAAFLRAIGSLSGGAAPPAAGSRGSARLNAIRSAASIPLLSVSPSFNQLVRDESVSHAVGGSGASRGITGAVFYNRTALAVTFPERPGAQRFRSTFGANEDITVRVTYLFHCGVPLVSRLMCDDYGSLRTSIPEAALTDLAKATATGDRVLIAGAVRRVRHSEERLDQAEPGMEELRAAEAPFVAWLFALTGSRFKVLRAEATLRNHGAPYSYR
jgi:hypothetical protein